MGKSEYFSDPVKKENLCSAISTLSMSCNGAKPSHSPQARRSPPAIPEDMEVFDNQVAGHSWSPNTIGMLKHENTILKPINTRKSACGEREIHFYETVGNSEDRDLVDLKELIPKYHGTREVMTNGEPVKCIVLEDLTADFDEPCIMDIKIGRRTWDPEASYEKIAKEESKFTECKRELGFCIPGFQVHKISNNELVKFNKDYGKNLNKETISEALKIFLNGETRFCRSLLMQILAPLWRIQKWARTQRRFQLYSSSILIAYDSKRLKECLKHSSDDALKPALKLTRSHSLYRPLSLAVLNNFTDKIPTGFSGQLTKEGPILTPTSRKRNCFDILPFRRKSNNVWQQSFHNLKRTHSFQNNYDKDVQNRKQSYTDILEDLSCEHKSELWVTVKMIDFAHVYPAKNCDLDRNYLQGIENLVKVLEEFLVDSE
ncbi:inositol polyphosphate multikinase [Harmonia axyridis]|uniref:inositol polyphosphate multikinase n=1 Tax=Harmonia axyridis TaxID=115357 RepID=UPI001E27909D|nr:inositol polyphosphate multikinase [Harmonia axyridis]XP_045478525.1 inositol polyphosphate multikinase [Harmonia axyridis]